MRRSFLRLVFCVVCGFAQKAVPDSKGFNGIAFFDSKTVWQSVPCFQSPRKALEKMLTELQQAYAVIEEGLRKESSLLQKKRMELQSREKSGPELGGVKHEFLAKDLDARWNAFHAKVLKVQKTVESKKHCIGAEYERVNTELQERLQRVVKSVAQKYNLQVVFSKEVIVFAEPHLDVTEEVILELKASHDEIHLDFKKCE